MGWLKLGSFAEFLDIFVKIIDNFRFVTQNIRLLLRLKQSCHLADNFFFKLKDEFDNFGITGLRILL